MVPHLPAAILILVNRPHPDKQEALALAAAVAERLDVVALCHHWPDCLVLFLLRYIAVVVCAVDPGAAAREAYDDAGLRLVIARPEPQVRMRREVNQLAVRMSRSGLTTQEIAQILEINSGDVRRALRKRTE